MKKTTKNLTDTRKGLVLRMAQQLLKPTNQVTTLEIKNALLKQHSDLYWDQAFVSQCMQDYETLGIFKITADNGTYRTYADPSKTIMTVVKSPRKVASKPAAKKSAVKPAPKKAVTKAPVKKVATKVTTKADKWSAATKSISRKAALNLMQNNKGRFFGAQFVKKDGSLRTINCQYLPNQDNQLSLGYVKVKESALVKAGDPNPIRNINIQTISKLSIGGTLYKVGK